MNAANTNKIHTARLVFSSSASPKTNAAANQNQKHKDAARNHFVSHKNLVS